MWGRTDVVREDDGVLAGSKGRLLTERRTVQDNFEVARKEVWVLAGKGARQQKKKKVACWKE